MSEQLKEAVRAIDEGFAEWQALKTEADPVLRRLLIATERLAECVKALEEQK